VSLGLLWYWLFLIKSALIGAFVHILKIHGENNVKFRVSMFIFLEEPDDGHNRPKLVAQNLQIKRCKQSWL
jgi:hypothetical protein